MLIIVYKRILKKTTCRNVESNDVFYFEYHIYINIYIYIYIILPYVIFFFFLFVHQANRKFKIVQLYEN